MVSQSISVFFCQKTNKRFFEMKVSFGARKAAAQTFSTERRFTIFARRNGRLNKVRSLRERTKTKDGDFFRSFLLSNRSWGRLDGQTARDDVSGENCIIVAHASTRMQKWKDSKSPRTRLAWRMTSRLPPSCNTHGNRWYPCPQGRWAWKLLQYTEP